MTGRDLRIYIATDGDLGSNAGQIILEGDDGQLAALVRRDDYRAVIIKAAHVVHGLRTTQFSTGEAVMARIAQLQAVRKELGL